MWHMREGDSILVATIFIYFLLVPFTSIYLCLEVSVMTVCSAAVESDASEPPLA